MHRRRDVLPRTTAGLFALLLLVGACSGGDDEGTSAAPEQTADAGSDDDPPPEPEEAEETDEEAGDATTDAAGDDGEEADEAEEVDEAEEPEAPQPPEIVRGVYSTVYSFWGERWDELIGLVETTELNAIVVDVKDEAGTLLWDIDHPLAEAGGGGEWREGSDPSERLQQLLDAGGYPIARVSCFKDTLVAQAHPELAVQEQGTDEAWLARKDFSWLNPYQQEAGQWCIDVGLAALEMGFEEVQFDYIRFPNGGDGDTSTIELPGVPDDRPREEWRHPDAITDFLADASEQIHEAGGVVAADLFGLVTYDFTWDAQGTGQVMERIAEHVDVISPMVYPSHYGPGNYGLDPHPIEYPYETVWNSMQEAQMRVQELHAEIRPWLEDFPAPWMGYDHDPSRVQEQLEATYDNGIEGWMLWNAANRYSTSVLEEGEARSKAAQDFVPPARTADPDVAPGSGPEREWPGHPDCEPDREKLAIGEGNLVGSTPPDPAPGADDPQLCQAS